MALPTFSMRDLLEAGAHFGHQTHRWNPKMEEYIFGVRNGIHIIDLSQTVPLLHQALVKVSETVAGGGRVLFVGTKRQASDIVKDAAQRSAQYYINHRWYGGTLTNWQTITNSIKRLRYLEELLEGEVHGFTKKELLHLTRERDKLQQAIGGIKDMGGIPDLLFVIDTNKEAIAVAEARKLNIPVIAILDSNSNSDGIAYPVPGNDDAGRAIALYCDLVARAALDGIEKATALAGGDMGAAAEPQMETLPEEPEVQATPVAEATPEASPVVQPEAAEADVEAAQAAPQEPAPEPAVAPAAPSGGFRRLDAPEGEPDDLQKISGLGKVMADKLNAHGIYHFWQIANMGADDLATLDEEVGLKGRAERDGWIEQAAKLMQEEAA
ncbi:MAG: 30S ribosomal protein S2 [Dichotomicrobium sp.]